MSAEASPVWRRVARAGPVAVAVAVAALSAGCDRKGGGEPAPDAEVAPAAEATQAKNSVAAPPPPDRPKLGITAFVTTVYKEPRDTSKKLGYLRVGSRVARSAEAATTKGCPAGWYEIHPRGFVCAGDEATLDMDHPVLRAASRLPDLKSPLPYSYGFVRAVLPLYLRVPSGDEQLKSEFKLKEHLDWYSENEATVQKPTLGANDVPLDERGVPIAGKKIGELGLRKNSLELGTGGLLGGQGEDDPVPFWLEGGKRLIPNISDFKVPEYAVFADRARRFTGLAFVGSFPTGADSLSRRFAITTDLRLAPTTKVKPDTGSPFHGIELDDATTLPLAFMRARNGRAYDVSKRRASPGEELEPRGVHPLTGKMRTVEGVRYYRTLAGRWLHQQEVGLALAPATFPPEAARGEKWIEISIKNQTLVLWEGKRPVYATLVSTGKAGMDDPKKSTATVRGVFKIRNKHVTATMDSNESSSVGGTATKAASTHVGAKREKAGSGQAKAAPAKSAAAKAAPEKGDGEVVPRKGDGEYGVTRRRGEGTYQLRDVPYIQYFEAGYALHAAYWHDVFGTPRSHGCINLSPIDAHRVFNFTEPAVPDGWHGVNSGEEIGEGTTVIIHE